MNARPRVIAFYLPQFHPIPENNEWWGKGFTEWRRVGSAKPLFRKHQQPVIPADLGYYDLRLRETREEQCQLARRAGIEGFCYWHYWFGNGKRLLEGPFNDVVNSGEPDFPFCLGWANESWKSKVWGGVGKDRTLIEQQYCGKDDDERHFYAILPALRDHRYIRMNGHPLFYLYKPDQHPYLQEFIAHWNVLAKKEGVSDKLFWVAQVEDANARFRYINLGIDAVSISPNVLMQKEYKSRSSLWRKVIYLHRMLLNRPLVLDYARSVRSFDIIENREENVIPTILPNWDHSPRSGKYAVVLQSSTPEKFKKHAKKVILDTNGKVNTFVFLKSWNEWGEGNYMEPDTIWGNQYIDALGDLLGIGHVK